MSILVNTRLRNITVHKRYRSATSLPEEFCYFTVDNHYILDGISITDTINSPELAFYKIWI